MPATKASAPAAVKIAYEPWAKQRFDGTWVGQSTIHASNARFRIAMAGRQSGKTLAGIAEIVMDALEHPGHINWWITPSFAVRDRVWDGLLEFIPAELRPKKHEVDLRIELVNGSKIYVKSAEAEDALVSASLDFAVCDEAGQWKETVWTRGIRPMFNARPHARALLIGTPRGRNWFYRMWLKGRPGVEKDAEYESFQWRTEDSPYSDEKGLIEARRNLPRDIYEQEYNADPLDNSAGVFRNVRSCIRRYPAEHDLATVIGADFARKHDFSVFIPMNTKRQAISVAYRAQDDYPIQKARLAAIAVANGFARIVADEASIGDPLIQDLRVAGFQVEGINTNGPVKRSIIENLRLAFEQSTISIPDDETLVDELEAYEYELLPSGQLRYSAPEGKHDDTVMALGLALWGQRGATPSLGQPTATSYGRRMGHSGVSGYGRTR